MIAHFFKHIIRRKFIFNQRISLCISMQTNSLAHLIHIVNMIHPFLIDDAQHHDTLQFPHPFFVADFLFFQFIQLHAQFFQVFLHFFFGHLFHSVFFDVDSAHRDNCREGFAQRIHIPFFRQLLIADMRVNDTINGLTNHPHNTVTQVFSIQYPAPFPINDFTLFIHHLVIFQQMFPDGKVIALHFFLRIFDGFGQHPRFNGFILAHPHGIHQFHGLF